MALEQYIANVIVSALFGLIPFFVGRKKQRHDFAWAGLAICTLAGVLLIPPVALLLALLFTVIILFTSRKNK